MTPARATLLRAHLEALLARFDPVAHRRNDPVSLVHRYTRREDKEIAGFLVSCLSYGRVQMILRTAGEALERLGSNPARAVRESRPSDLLRRFEGFRHRFTTGRDLAALLGVCRTALRAHGTLEAWFAREECSAPTIEPALTAVARTVRTTDHFAYFGAPTPGRTSSFWFLVPSPKLGSTCKRLCMYLRWMTRRGDGVDLGLWRSFRPAQLVIPLDTHVARITYALGLTRRRTSGWKTALEVTRSLCQLDADDPLRFDFALCHLGITGTHRSNRNLRPPGVRFSAQLSQLAAESNRRAALMFDRRPPPITTTCGVSNRRGPDLVQAD